MRVNFIKQELAMMNGLSTFCLQECWVTLEAKKKRTLNSFWFYPNKFSEESSHLAVSHSSCNFVRNSDLYLVLNSRYFPQSYKSGTQSAITKMKTLFIYSNHHLWNTVVTAYLILRAHKAGKTVVSWSAVPTGNIHIPPCSCVKVQKPMLL